MAGVVINFAYIFPVFFKKNIADKQPKNQRAWAAPLGSPSKWQC